MPSPTRRSVLSTGATALVGSIAGCSSIAENEGEDERVKTLEGRVEELEAENERLRQRLRNASASGDSDDVETRTATLTATPTATPEEGDEQVEKLRQRIAELESENERLRKQLSRAQNGESSEFGEETIRRAREVGRSARRAVVYLRIEKGNGAAESGTGWFYDENHIVTNAHVVGDGDADINVWTLEQTEIAAELVNKTDRYESDTDLALLRLSGDETAPHSLATGDASSLSEGQPVLQVGHPLFVGKWMIALGNYLRTNRLGDLVTKMPHTSGNSGSPLLTLEGDVVGLTWGSMPARDQGGPNETPEPSDPVVHEEYPYQDRIRAQHEAIGDVEAKVSEWT